MPALHHHAHTSDEAGETGVAPADSRRRLGFVLALAATYMVAEALGGLFTGSLALLADAGHMLSDVAALALSIFALWLANKPAPAWRTFGYRRSEILAALANGVMLVVVAVFILLEAVERLGAPPPVKGLPMLAIASGGLLVNLLGLRILHGDWRHNLNLRAARLHVLSDALGSVGAMSAGLLNWGLGWRLADPVASLLIAALILRSCYALLRETVDVLLETAPAQLDMAELERALTSVPGVVSAHDLHVWTITSGMTSLSCHLHTRAEVDDPGVLSAIQALLRERYRIRHVTIQLEPEGFEENVEVC